ncbi:MarR family transcriptional regulator [Sulfitobacter sp. LCG007]
MKIEADQDDTQPGALPRLGEIGLENYAPYLMNRIMGRYNAALRAELAELGLTTPQMRALAVLSVMDGILIRELSVYAVVEQSTLSRALEKLVRDGKVRREADPSDSRAARLYLTDAGREDYIRLWPHMAQSYRNMFRDIDAEESRAFVATLQKILRNVRVHDF